MIFSYMNAVLGKKEALRLFQIIKKKTDNLHHIKVCPRLFFFPTGTKRNLCVYP